MSKVNINDEKSDGESVDRIDIVEQEPQSNAQSELPRYDDKEVKRILRKRDWRLLPVLSLLYLLASLDRGNIGNAQVADMRAELRLNSSQYNIALTVFFIPYAVFEVPSNVVLKPMRPSIWISILMVLWGVVMTLQGIVQTHEHLVITRVLLGLFESGYFPAATYLLTTYYCRFEVQTRMAVFFSAAFMASAFSGLLAVGIHQMDGIANVSGWRWIFYSIAAVGFIALFAIPHPRHPGLAYAMFFTIPAGVYPPLIGILSWIGNNLAREMGYDIDL